MEGGSRVVYFDRTTPAHVYSITGLHFGGGGSTCKKQCSNGEQLHCEDVGQGLGGR